MIVIENSSFANIGSDIDYYESIDLKQSHYEVNDYATAAPILNINAFQG